MTTKDNNSGSDFSTVKVGDKLWLRADEEGWLSVESVRPYTDYPVEMSNNRAYTFSGQYILGGPQVLFYDKVEIVPPPRPRKMVKKMVMVRPFLDPHTQTIEVTSHLNCVLDYCGLVQIIEIEVEE